MDILKQEVSKLSSDAVEVADAVEKDRRMNELEDKMVRDRPQNTTNL